MDRKLGTCNSLVGCIFYVKLKETGSNSNRAVFGITVPGNMMLLLATCTCTGTTAK